MNDANKIDIVTRLRKPLVRIDANNDNSVQYDMLAIGRDMEEAAALIERLRAELISSASQRKM